MKQITLNIPDNKFAFFMQLVRSLDFIQIASSEQNDEYSDEFIHKIQESRKEYKEGDFISVEKENLKEFLAIK
ncbi:MAG: DUF2683 family protein [Spirosomataceae bacterium]